MAAPEDQHDTLALTRPAPESPYPVPAGHASGPTGSWAAMQVPAGAAWSQVPPFASPAPPPVIQRNNAAVVGATLGSVSLFLSVIPLFGIVAWLLAPIGLLTSAVGLMVGMSRHAGRVGAVFGLLSSGLALLVCCAWVLLLLAF